MRFDIITIFPDIFDSYLKESIVARAQKKGLIKIDVHNLRDWTADRHKTVDDKPFGGGVGMVLKVDPIYRAVKSLKPKTKNLRLRASFAEVASATKAEQGFGGQAKSKIILFTPRGKKFDQKMAYRFSKLDRLIMICGRYEGVDERVAKYIADEEVSIGDYVLMGGELPAMVLVETIARLIPGVLGKPQLLKDRTTRGGGFVEYPEYTRPPKFFPEKFKRARPQVWKVPKVLLSGDHKKIEEWKREHGREIH